MKRIGTWGIATLLLAGLLAAGCRSTIHRAAVRGDIAAVQHEITHGADVNDKPHPAHMLWIIPAMPVAITTDIAQLCLAIGTLGIYPITMDAIFGEHECLLTHRLSCFMNTPAEVARSYGHEDIVSLLVRSGATPPTNKCHLRGKKNMAEGNIAAQTQPAHPHEATAPAAVPEASSTPPAMPSVATAPAAPATKVLTADWKEEVSRPHTDSGALTFSGPDFHLGARSLHWNNRNSIARMLKNGRFSSLSSIEQALGCKSDGHASDAAGRYDMWYYTWFSPDLTDFCMGVLATRSHNGTVQEVAYMAIPVDARSRFYGDEAMIQELKVLPTKNYRSKALRKVYEEVSQKHNRQSAAYMKRRSTAMVAEAKQKAAREFRQGVSRALVEGLSAGVQSYAAPVSSGDDGGAASGSSSSSSSSGGGKTVTKRVDCSTCSGKGSMRGTLGTTVTCPNCRGSGKLSITETTGSSGGGWQLKKETCTMCKGGKTIRSGGTVKACPGCRGRGYNHSIP